MPYRQVKVLMSLGQPTLDGQDLFVTIFTREGHRASYTWDRRQSWLTVTHPTPLQTREDILRAAAAALLERADSL